MAKIVTAEWVDSNPTTDLDHFEVWRKTLVGGTYAKISGDIALGVQTYVDSSTLADSTQYYYEVRAYNATGSYNSIEANITISGGAAGWIVPLSSYSYDSIPEDISGLAPGGETTGAYSFAINQAQDLIWILWRSSKTITEHSLSGGIDITTISAEISNLPMTSGTTLMDLTVLDSDDCFYLADYGQDKIWAMPMPTANDLSSIVSSPAPALANHFVATQPRSAMVKDISGAKYLYYTESADKVIHRRLVTDPKDMTTVAGSDTDSLDTAANITTGHIHSIKFSTDGLNMYLLQTAAGLSEVHRYLLSSDGVLAGATYQESRTFTESNEHRGMYLDGDQLILGSAGTGVTDTLYNYNGA